MKALKISEMNSISGGRVNKSCKNAIIGAGIASGGLLLSAAGDPVGLAFDFAGFIWEVGNNLGACHWQF